MDIEEDEGKSGRETYPEDDQTRNKAYEGRHRCEVPKCLGTKETWERVLLHRAVAILLLRMEHVGDLRHKRQLVLRLGLVAAVQREGVDAEGRRKIDFMALVRPGGRPCRRKVAVVDALCGCDKVQSVDGLGTGNDGGGTGSAFEQRRCAAGEREGGRGSWRLGGTDSRLTRRYRRHHAGAGTPCNFLFVGHSEVVLILFCEHFRRARRTPLCPRLRIEPHNRPVDRPPPPRVVPVSWPVLANCPPRLAHILEVCAAEVLVLLNVEPEVQDIFRVLTLQEQATANELVDHAGTMLQPGN